tara:strand:- start:10543 stop:11220 length:678 start_codon:yes stop_codon:yes gene_type:complete
MAKVKEKESAIKFRQLGYSITEIAKMTDSAKSTVSGWCRDIKLSEKAIKKLAKRNKQKSSEGLLRYSETVRAKRIKETELATKRGVKKLGSLSNRDIYCIGLGLYWGEGYKTGSQEFGFTNSDPDMMTFYVKWLEIVFHVEKKDLILRVSVNEAHANRIDEIEKFWSEKLAISLSQFTKPSLIKTQSKKQYENFDKHMGTLRIKVRKGTNMRREVLGAIEAIKVK